MKIPKLKDGFSRKIREREELVRFLLDLSEQLEAGKTPENSLLGITGRNYGELTKSINEAVRLLRYSDKTFYHVMEKIKEDSNEEIGRFFDLIQRSSRLSPTELGRKLRNLATNISQDNELLKMRLNLIKSKIWNIRVINIFFSIICGGIIKIVEKGLFVLHPVSVHSSNPLLIIFSLFICIHTSTMSLIVYDSPVKMVPIYLAIYIISLQYLWGVM